MAKKIKPKILILCGDGLNCENETAYAFNHVGCSSHIIHISQLLKDPDLLDKHHVFVIPGGFAFGDELGSGQVLALKLKSILEAKIHRFLQDDKLVLGICNGFQALVKLGIFDGIGEQRKVGLAVNRDGHFIDRWVELNISEAARKHSPWLNYMSKINLPVRHGEGRIVFHSDEQEPDSIYKAYARNKQIALTYTEDINGAHHKIAGLLDRTGRVLGLMPHPEAAINPLLMPEHLRAGFEKHSGIEFFQNAYRYFNRG